MTTSTALPLAPPGAAPRADVDAAIRTRRLTKAYAGRRVVDGVDLVVPRGSISGFVGPNGAGKTTTLRMLLGLVRPSDGGGEVLGGSLDHPLGYLPRVGALIEGPAFYPNLSGRANLRVLATLGGFSRARVEEVLEVVELRDRGADQYRTYSLGMKQRLGVAAALLPQPELLVLDEPTNGLDPNGIIETRALLRRFRDEGMTVFVSSHLLAELEQVADWLVLIDRGRLAYQGPIGDLMGSSRSSLLVAGESPDDLEVIAAVARRLGSGARVVDRHVHIDDATIAAQLNRAAMKAGVTLTELTVQRATLEESFLAVTRGEQS
ncbi:MAG TPA: ATP-binding cassette domain-containing protein [Candidatus Dormibacteraeota bacterium]|nr:ATP-binding cassette domain-containing protein [Candidatus Dormibacteraeota bacterium]